MRSLPYQGLRCSDFFDIDAQKKFSSSNGARIGQPDTAAPDHDSLGARLHSSASDAIGISCNQRPQESLIERTLYGCCQIVGFRQVSQFVRELIADSNHSLCGTVKKCSDDRLALT